MLIYAAIIIVIILILLLIIFTMPSNYQEGMTTQSNEAIQDIASLYNKGLLTISNQTITGNLTVNGSCSFLPKGVIIAWNGNVAPPGWQLCDGTNNTPDLRGRFILGSGKGNGLTNRNWKDVSGEENHTLNANEMPSHQHYFGIGGGGGFSSDGGIGTDSGYSCNEGQCKYKEQTVSAGGNQPHNNMPPFYVLAYIMRMI